MQKIIDTKRSLPSPASSVSRSDAYERRRSRPRQESARQARHLSIGIMSRIIAASVARESSSNTGSCSTWRTHPTEYRATRVRQRRCCIDTGGPDPDELSRRSGRDQDLRAFARRQGELRGHSRGRPAHNDAWPSSSCLNPNGACRCKPITLLGDADKVARGNFIFDVGQSLCGGLSRRAAERRRGASSANIRRRGATHLREDERIKPLHYYNTLLQTDARLHLGCSGGALLNLRWRNGGPVHLVDGGDPRRRNARRLCHPDQRSACSASSKSSNGARKSITARPRLRSWRPVAEWKTPGRHADPGRTPGLARRRRP